MKDNRKDSMIIPGSATRRSIKLLETEHRNMELDYHKCERRRDRGWKKTQEYLKAEMKELRVDIQELRTIRREKELIEICKKNDYRMDIACFQWKDEWIWLVKISKVKIDKFDARLEKILPWILARTKSEAIGNALKSPSVNPKKKSKSKRNKKGGIYGH